MKSKIIIIITSILLIFICYIASSNSLNFLVIDKNDQHNFNKNTCSKEEDIICSKLPIVLINNDKDSNYDLVNIIDNEKNGNHLNDTPKINTKSIVDSLDDNKYVLRFIDDEEKYKNEKVMGMQDHYEWILYNSKVDKSLIRNYLWYHISTKIMTDAPNSRFCKLFINDEYKGVYLMVESPSIGDNSRMKARTVIKEKTYSGYILRYTEEEIENKITTFSNYAFKSFANIELVYPSLNVSDELKNYIIDDMSKFEKTIYSYDYNNHSYGYYDYINIDSFVNYLIINELAQNYNGVNNSTYIYKDMSGDFNLYVWDFDNANNNEYSIDDFRFQNAVWYYMLMKDEHFTNKIITRYKYLRRHYLSDDYLINYIDEIARFLDGEVENNDYKESIEELKENILKRGKFLDENIEMLKQFSHKSKVKKFNK